MTENEPLPDEYILIVEDIVELAKYEAMFLKREGYEVRHATQASEALPLIQAQMPLLIILDLSLPDVFGWEFIDTLREQYDPDMLPPIIIATAYSDTANKLIGKIYEVADYLIQPLSPAKFLEAVKNVLD